jgi:pimeloyl-ACP methyl ester carboxylesterase
VAAARRSVDRWYSATYLREHPEAREQTIERMSSLDAASYTNAYRVLATTDLVADLSEIIAPTLAMTGEHDVGSPPRMSRTIAERVRSGRWTVIPDARHSVLVEQPERVAKELLDHVS